jgi:hypothetical protein
VSARSSVYEKFFLSTHFMFQFDFPTIHDGVSINPNSEARKNRKVVCFWKPIVYKIEKKISEISELTLSLPCPIAQYVLSTT